MSCRHAGVVALIHSVGMNASLTGESCVWRLPDFPCAAFSRVPLVCKRFCGTYCTGDLANGAMNLDDVQLASQPWEHPQLTWWRDARIPGGPSDWLGWSTTGCG